MSGLIFLVACGNGNSKVDQVIQNQILEADGNVNQTSISGANVETTEETATTDAVVATGDNYLEVDLKNVDEDIDVDLTKLSSTMVYSEVYNMMYTPNDYIGKTIRMRGLFVAYSNSDGTVYYPAVIIADATACCSQGLEFLVEGEPDYPEGYPQLEEEVTVTGEFETYEEDGYLFCRLKNAKWTY